MFGKHDQIRKILLTLVVATIALSTNFSLAETTQDSDMDGLTDDAEITTYHTDRTKADTDEDGVLDAQEILDNTNPTDPGSNLLNTYKLDVAQPLFRTGSPVMWYIGRISGIAAFVVFTWVTCFGLLMTSKFLLKFKVFSAPTALETHSFSASIIGLALVVIHAGSLMFDSTIKLTLPEILIPFTVIRTFKSALGFDLNLPISLGILATYLALVLVSTSKLRGKVIKPKIWRAIHYTSFGFYLLFLFHGILTGSDSNQLWAQGIYLISVIIVTTLLLVRIFAKKYFIQSIKSQVSAEK